jgi:hypothetical protein
MKALRYSYYGNILDYIEYTLSDHAVPGKFPRDLQPGPFIVPGQYSLVLGVDGKTLRQPLTVSLDPRVHVPPSDLVQQLDAGKNIAAQMSATYDGYEQVHALQEAIAERQKSLGADATATKKDAADALKALADQAAEVGEGKPADLGIGPLNRELARFAFMIESGDARPATLLETSVEQSCQNVGKRLAQWRDLNQQKISPVNAVLQKYNTAALPVVSNIPAAPACQK